MQVNLLKTGLPCLLMQTTHSPQSRRASYQKSPSVKSPRNKPQHLAHCQISPILMIFVTSFLSKSELQSVAKFNANSELRNELILGRIFNEKNRIKHRKVHINALKNDSFNLQNRIENGKRENTNTKIFQ